MAADHQTSERVYSALKRDMLGGRMQSGRLQITILEERYRASATPVREALLRLVGEGLVVMPPAGGFAIWQPGVKEVVDLHELTMRLCYCATTWDGRQSLEAADENMAVDIPTRIEHLFSFLARRTGNKVLTAIMASLNDRLHRARLVEPLILTGLEHEYASLAGLAQHGNPAALRRAILTYHRRRIRRAADIVDKVAAGNSGKED